MHERLIEENEVRQVLSGPDSVDPDTRHGGKLLTRYFGQWDRILVVAVQEQANQATVLVKTVLWSKAS